MQETIDCTFCLLAQLLFCSPGDTSCWCNLFSLCNCECAQHVARSDVGPDYLLCVPAAAGPLLYGMLVPPLFSSCCAACHHVHADVHCLSQLCMQETPLDSSLMGAAVLRCDCDTDLTGNARGSTIQLGIHAQVQPPLSAGNTSWTHKTKPALHAPAHTQQALMQLVIFLSWSMRHVGTCVVPKAAAMMHRGLRRAWLLQ